MLRVERLYQFPVKSCAGTEVNELVVGTRGPVGDRMFMFTRPSGDFMSQRDFPRLCLVRTARVKPYIVFSFPGKPDFELPIFPAVGRQKIRATMHEKQFPATISNSHAGRWLADCLGLSFEPLLVFQRPEDERRVRAGANGEGVEMGFQDGYPFMVISEASLSDLNNRLPAGEAVGMDRFRPNIVVSSCRPYFEDTVVAVSAGGVRLVGETLCSRCPTTQTDQNTAERGKEPMKTLLSYRPTRPDSKGNPMPVFGRNFSHTETGTIRQGGVIQVCES